MPQGRPNLRAVYVRCMTCSHAITVPIRDKELLIPLCPQCDKTWLEFAGQLVGMVSSDGVKLQRATATENLYLAKTDVFTMLQALLSLIRPKTGAGTFRDDRCVFCDGEPHTVLTPCQCVCHKARMVCADVQTTDRTKATGTDG